jgi:hypothetical protein
MICRLGIISFMDLPLRVMPQRLIGGERLVGIKWLTPPFFGYYG